MLYIPLKIIKLFFRLVVAVMWILLSILGFLIPRNDKAKSKMDNYAKEAWVKSGK